MTREELDKFVEDVKNRPYLEYPESADEELNEILGEKEIKKLKGRGFIYKIAKYFRDKRQAKAIKKVDNLVEHMNNNSNFEFVPGEYIK